MNQSEAKSVLSSHLSGRRVDPALLDHAHEVIRQHAQPRSNSHKFALPYLPAKEREYANAILAFNLGRALRHP